MTLPNLEAATVGGPITRQGIAFFPVFLPGNELPPIATGESCGLVIDEFEVPSVQELRMTNPTDRAVLVVEGEHFLGGKQNRAVSSTVLVGARSGLVVPVSCLEQGRWGRRRSWRRAESFAPNAVRAVQREGVARSLRGGGSRRSDQGRVWQEVSSMLDLKDIASETAAASDLEYAYRRERSSAESVQELAGRGPLSDQCGVAVACGGCVIAMDLFGSPHLLAAHWKQIVRSHFVESAPQGDEVSCDEVQTLIRRFARAPTHSAPGIGLGAEHHAADGPLTGQALTLNGALVHAVFSRETGDRNRHGHTATAPQAGHGAQSSNAGRMFRPESANGDATLESSHLNRERGLMAGIAVGNLLGIVMEGWPRSRIEREYPDGVKEIAARSGYPDDDDIAQAIVIADAATAAAGLDADDLGQRFWSWAETNGAGIGGLTADVLALYGGDYPQQLAARRARGTERPAGGMPIIEASRHAWGRNRAGNGALMRCAPLAIRWRDDPERLVRESVLSAVPTHWDRRCGWSCAIANLAIAGALRGETPSPECLLRLARDGMAASLRTLGDYGYRAEIPSSVSDTVAAAARSSMNDLRLDVHPGIGFTLLALQAALVCFWQAADFETGLRKVIEAGGDTDTNGAIVGAALGARFGHAAIPERWRRRTDEIRQGRVSMESLADCLAAAARGERQ